MSGAEGGKGILGGRHVSAKPQRWEKMWLVPVRAWAETSAHLPVFAGYSPRPGLYMWVWWTLRWRGQGTLGPIGAVQCDFERENDGGGGAQRRVDQGRLLGGGERLRRDGQSE